MITLLLADDHHLFRRGLRQLCEIVGGFTVVAEAESGSQAVEMARTHRPAVILMDIRMPGLNGVEATRLILAEQPEARILVLTMYRQDHQVASALRAGACGYLLKNCPEESLFAAIRAAHRGEGWLDPAVTPGVLTRFARGERHEQSHPLSEPEMEVLRLVAQGADNQSIAAQLHLASGTVANRLREIYSKLGVKNRTEAALYALRQGWATLDPDDE
jgi:DNA-binding NarL/FixJ family response regulator